jgi:hypothetical protein|tara:strand:- start:389 stop:667 length:279 start_codon:yes stop_codon:yes gene_type:complete
MSVYVSETVIYRVWKDKNTAGKHHRSYYHFWADKDDEYNLHHIARKIGLKRSWFKAKSNIPHYLIVWPKREMAIKNGAIETTMKSWSKNKRS